MASAKSTTPPEWSRISQRSRRNLNENLIPKNWLRSRRIGRRTSPRRERHDSIVIQVVVTSYDRCPVLLCILHTKHRHHRNNHHRPQPSSRHRSVKRLAVDWCRDPSIQHLCQIRHRVRRFDRFRRRLYPKWSPVYLPVHHPRHHRPMCQPVRWSTRLLCQHRRLKRCQSVRHDQRTAPSRMFW